MPRGVEGAEGEGRMIHWIRPRDSQAGQAHGLVESMTSSLLAPIPAQPTSPHPTQYTLSRAQPGGKGEAAPLPTAHLLDEL